MNVTDFFIAIEQGNRAGTLDGLRSGFTAETVNDNSITALDVALEHGQTEIADLLMSPPVLENVVTAVELETMPEAASRSVVNQSEPLAIVGMSCRFAADADNLSNFWQSLLKQTDTTTVVPGNRFVSKADYHEAKKYPAAFLRKDIGLFDAGFFRISPNDAALMDPQQRMLLEEVYHAFEQGGFDLHDLSDKKVGVYVGQMTHDYMDIMRADSDEGNERFATGNIGSVLSGRIAYLYNFLGEALTVNTACSSSLAGVHIAANSLRNGQVDMALVAGVNAIIDPRLMSTAAKAGMTSEDGTCKAFSEDANGYGRGEGAGVVLLKRLSDAQLDGDNILALIRGSALNQDGQSSQLTAPKKSQQIAVIQDALHVSGLHEDDVDLVEAHGTGTKLGDQIETAALTEVFGQRPIDKRLVVRSVKSNIGHCEAAAGVAGLIKTVLSLQHGIIPGQARLRQLSSKLDLSSVQIDREQKSWQKRGDRPRRAGISSFGFSGTNSHVVLEEAPESILDPAVRLKHQWSGLSDYPLPTQPSSIDKKHALVLSAKTKETLASLVKSYETFLKDGTWTNKELVNLAYTAGVGRTHYQHRTAIVFDSKEDLLAQLAKTNSVPVQEKYCLSNLSDKQLQVMQKWYQQDVYLQSIVAKHVTTQELALIENAPSTFTEQQKSLFAFILLFAAATRYHNVGFSLLKLQSSGIGAEVQAVLASKKRLENVLADIRAGKLSMDRALNAGVSIGDGYEVFLRACTAHYQQGNKLNWSDFWRGHVCQKITLPLYPFQQQRYWYDSVLTIRPRQKKENSHVGLVHLAGGELVYEHRLDLTDDASSYLAGHRVGDAVVFPAAAYIDLILRAVKPLKQYHGLNLHSIQFKHPLVLSGEDATVCQLRLKPLSDKQEGFAVEVYAWPEKGSIDEAVCYVSAVVQFESVASPSPIDVAQQLSTGKNYTYTEVYERLTKLGLFYRSDWQLVQSGVVQNNQSIIRIAKQDAQEDSLQTVTTLDAALHSTILLIDSKELPIGTGLVPKMMEHFIISGDLSRTAFVLATKEAVGNSFNFAIRFVDEEENQLAHLERYSAAALQTNTFSKSGLSKSCFLVEWKPHTITNSLNPKSYFKAPDFSRFNVALPQARELPRKDNQWLYQYGLLIFKMMLVKRWSSLQIAGSTINMQQVETGKQPEGHVAILLRKGFDYLAQAQIIRIEDGKASVVTPLPNLAELKKSLVAMAVDEQDIQAVFLQSVTREIDRIVDGEIDPLTALFPEDVEPTSFRHAAAIYQHAKDPRLANMVTTRMVEALNAYGGDGSLRILEIGAGTGGTTRALVTALKQFTNVHYVYTDLSPAFARNAEECFANTSITHQFEVLDISLNPLEQGFAPGQFDVIIATNVLHATPNLPQTLAYVQQLLVKGGVSIISETIEDAPWLDLTFGLTPGWWVYNDGVRLNSPLLTQSQWERLLLNAGMPCQYSQGDSQRVFLACSQEGPRSLKATQTNAINHFVIAFESVVGQQITGKLNYHGLTAKCLLLTTPDSMDQALKLITSSENPTVYFLADLMRDINAVMADYQARVAKPMLNLLKTLHGKKASINLITVKAQSENAEQATLSGFLTSAAAENHQWQVKVIDSALELGSHEDVIDKVVRLGIQSSNEVEFIVTTKGALVPRLSEHSELMSSQFMPLNTDGVVLITGGTGEIGQALVAHLEKQGHRQFALLCRKKSDLSFTGKDIEIVTYQDDLSDAVMLRQTWKRIVQHQGKISKVYHLAGTLDDKSLNDMTWDAVSTVFKSKVVGAYHLHQLTLTYPVDQFVLFSSVASLLSTEGQMNHVAANRYLDSLAHLRRAKGLPAVAINWGFWSQIGSAARIKADVLGKHKGFLALTPEQCFMALDALVQANPSQAVIAQFDWEAFFKPLSLQTVPPLFREIADSNTNLLTQAEKVSSSQFDWEAFVHENPQPRAQQQAIAKMILELLRQSLRVKQGIDILTNAPLNAFPVQIDSFAEKEVVETLNEKFGWQSANALTTNVFFSHESIDDMAKTIWQQLSQDKNQTLGQSVSPNAKSAAISKPVEKDAPLERDAIAIIGMSLRFPGANTAEEYWQALNSSYDPIIASKQNRSGVNCYYGNAEGGAAKTPRAALLSTDISQFDADFFGISDEEVTVMDPQQRLLLQMVWEALEQAGIAPSSLKGSNTSIVIGIAANEFGDLLLHHSNDEQLSRYHASGNNPSATVGRISYQLGLQGANLAINTACSSSLVALDTACRQIREGTADLAITGASNLILSPGQMKLYQSNGMLSPTHHCHTFSNQADGMVRSEGCAIYLLKSLSRALKDGDNILAVIEGTAVNQNGASSSFMRPDMNAQRSLIKQSLTTAKVAADQIDWVETHGTGTKLGDPVEVEALTKELGVGGRKLPLGAVKSNFGHAEAAAGAAGLSKIIMALHHSRIPPNRFDGQLNPQLSPFLGHMEPVTKTMMWEPASMRTRRALLSSFGFSGTNAQAVIAEAPTADIFAGNRLSHQWHMLQQTDPSWLSVTAPEGFTSIEHQLVVLSAKTENALREQLIHLRDWLEKYTNIDESDLLERIAMTLSKGRDHFHFRAAIQASTLPELQEKIGRLLEKTDFNPIPKNQKNLAFLFTGQGSQYANMGQDLYQKNPVFRAIYEHCSQLLKGHLDVSLTDIMFGAQSKEYLSKTTYAQPALFVLEYALARMLIAYGMKPTYMLGHSVGEYVAATLTGCMSLEDALKLICARGKIMEKAAPGKMLVVSTDDKTALSILSAYNIPLDIAGKNHQSQTVLSGATEAADKAALVFKEKKIRATELGVGKAFHSRCMEPVLAEFREIAEQLVYHSPNDYTFISSLTGKMVTVPLSAGHWVEHLRQGVDFIGAIQTLDSMGFSQCCEIGPKAVLITMAKMILDKKVKAIDWYDTLSNSKPDTLQMQTMVSRFYELGGKIHWKPFWIGTTVRPIELPTYAFQYQSYWPEVLGGPQRAVNVKQEMVIDEPQQKESWSPAQQTVVNCLNKALPGKEILSLDNSFTEYGGSSLEVPPFQEALYAATCMTFSMKELEDLSLRELAQRLPEQFAAIEVQIAPSDKDSWYKPFKLNPIQYAYWIGRQGIIPLGHVSAHGYLEVKMTQIDVGRLQHALNQLIRQHHMLRVTVNRQGMQCVQENVPEYQIPCIDLATQTELVRKQRLESVRNELSHQVKDASVWPLFDIRVTKVANGEHLLHLSFDSLIVDMYSMRLLFDEWYRLYTDASYQLTPQTFTFRDYHLALERLKQQGQYKKAEAYWLERVKTMPLGPDLPLLMDPAQVINQSFARCNAVVQQHQWTAINEKASALKVPPTTVLLTLFSIVLGRYSKRKEFLVNLTLFRRNQVHPEVKQLLGDFTNVEVFATNVTKAHTNGFSSMIKASKDRLLTDLDHADYNGVDVQRALAAHYHLEGGEAVAPIVFTSLLNLKLGRNSEQQTGDSVWQQFGDVVYSITQTPQIWLDHKTFESTEGLVVEWDYVEALFDPKMMAQMHADYTRYLEYLSQADWQQPLPDMVTQRLLPVMNALNQTAVPDYVKPETLVSLMARQVLETPNRRAVFDEQISLTYQQFDELTTRVVAALQEQGVTQGDFVGISIDRSVDMMIAIVATLKAGGAYLSIETSLPEMRKRYVLNNSQTKVVLTNNAHHDWCSDKETKVMLIADAKQATASLVPVLIKPNDLAYLLYTSGSSGEPKGAMIEHLSVVNRLLWMKKDYQVHAEDVFIQKTPVSFDVSIWELFLPLISGASLFMPKPEGHKDVAYLKGMIQTHGITRVHFVPSMLEIFMQGRQASALPSLKTVFCSGEALLPSQVNAFSKQYPQADLVNFYGPTEVAVDVTYWVAPKTEVNEVPIGKPAANVEIIIVDEMGLLCPVGVPGELLLAGVQVGRGYLRLPEKTARTFVPNPYPFSKAGERAYRTGDLAYINTDGQVMYLGRMDDQIKVRGQRIELGEVQEGINRLPMVQQSAVLPIKDERNQTSLVAFVIQDKVPSKQHMDKMLTGAIVDKDERNAFTVNNESHLANIRSSATITLFAEEDRDERLFQRKSYRSFEGSGMTNNTLLDWLKAVPKNKATQSFSLNTLLKSLAAFKNDDLVFPKYPYPSAGSLYPVKCYLAIGKNDLEIASGYYYFDQVRHRLELCAKQDSAIEPGIRVALVAHKRMMEPLYGAFWQDFARIEAGAMQVLLARQCQSMQSALIKDESSQWTNHLDFVNADDVLCGSWTLQQNMAQLQVSTPLSMWLYVNDKLSGLKPGLYYWDGQQLAHKVEAKFPLHLLNDGDNAKVVAHSSAIAFFSAPSAFHEAIMAIGSQVMTWMETGIERQIGLCPMGTCPVPQAFAESIGVPVLLAVAIGSVSKQQIAAIESSQANGSVQTVDAYLHDQLKHTVLTEAMYPDRFYVVHDIPTTGNGKLDKRVLLDIAKKEGSGTSLSLVKPRTALEKAIYEVWQEKEILQGRNFGIHDSFKAAGGNSMTQNTISLRLQDQFKVTVSNADVFTNSTITKQAKLIDLREDDELKTIASFALASMVVKGNIKMIETLLSKGKIDINQQDSRGRTALYIAAYHGHKDIVELLLRYRARVDSAKHSGVTPKECAQRRGHQHLLDLLTPVKVSELTMFQQAKAPSDGASPSASFYKGL